MYILNRYVIRGVTVLPISLFLCLLLLEMNFNLNKLRDKSQVYDCT